MRFTLPAYTAYNTSLNQATTTFATSLTPLPPYKYLNGPSIAAVTTPTHTSGTRINITTPLTPIVWYRQDWTIPAGWALMFFDCFAFLLLLICIANGLFDWRLEVSLND